MKKIESKIQLDELIAKFDGQKYKTNCFLLGSDFDNLILKSRLFYISEESVLFLIVKNEHFEFLNFYYYIKENAGFFDLKNDLPLVLELPFRGPNPPEFEIEFLRKIGFKEHILRYLMGLNLRLIEEYSEKNVHLNGSRIEVITQTELSESIEEGIKNAFDYYTGDQLTKDQVEDCIKNGLILGVFKNSELAGFLRFYIKNNVSWIGHIVVFREFSGFGFGNLLVDYYLNYNLIKGIKTFNHWVVRDNIVAEKMYNKFGFKNLNKYSLSLIKH